MSATVQLRPGDGPTEVPSFVRRPALLPVQLREPGELPVGPVEREVQQAERHEHAKQLRPALPGPGNSNQETSGAQSNQRAGKPLRQELQAPAEEAEAPPVLRPVAPKAVQASQELRQPVQVRRQAVWPKGHQRQRPEQLTEQAA